MLHALRLVLVVPFFACASSPTPAAQEPATPAPVSQPAATSVSDAEIETLVAESLAFFAAVADAVVAASGDCALIATGIDRVMAEHADLLDRAKAMEADRTAGERAGAGMDARGAELMPILERLFGAVGDCREDPAVQTAIDRLASS